MSSASSYIHALEGRLRVKSASVKGSRQKAQEIEAHFREHDGITEVVANPLTGSILFHYDSRCIDQQQILDALHMLGHVSKDDAVRRQSHLQPVHVTVKIPEDFGQKLIKTVVTSTVEAALQRLVYALI
ncbi:MAG: HMA2 domain-containing protein [Candidatus Binatia bacterium]